MTETKVEKNNYVYILRCSDNSLYTGWTNNIEKRLNTHKTGKGAKYTRGRLPLELVYLEVFAEKRAALAREYSIKKLSKKEKEALISETSNAVKKEIKRLNKIR